MPLPVNRIEFHKSRAVYKNLELFTHLSTSLHFNCCYFCMVITNLI